MKVTGMPYTGTYHHMSPYFRHHRGAPRGRHFGASHARTRLPRPRRHSVRAHAGGIDVSRFINSAPRTEEVREAYEPKHRFADFALDARIKANIARKGYETPTPIQDQAIPHILKGRDIVGIADTGTGKTGAFLIPLVDKLVRDRAARILVIVPTRELAVQIDEEYRGFSHGSGFGSVCAVGGANINRQIAGMRRDPRVVIGTPGRLKDLMERRVLDLSRFGTVVLDEADRMLDMGFIHDMKLILSRMPNVRHTLFFSATLSRDIEALIGNFLVDPVRISVKTGDTAHAVHQDVVRTAGKEKIEVLHTLLADPECTKVLVFGRTKRGVEKLSKALEKRGFAAASIHGNKSQRHRQRALDAFKAGKVCVLVATDVAARGIDVADVSHVINYDAPNTYEDYVHRIGRTGRAGKRGKALTFVD